MMTAGVVSLIPFLILYTIHLLIGLIQKATFH